MSWIDEDPVVRHVRELGCMVTSIQDGRLYAKLLEQEVIAIIESNRHFHEENERLKRLTDISALEKRVAALESAQR
jgi:hypothetical protein